MEDYTELHYTCHVLLLLLTVPMYTIPTRSFVVVHYTCHVLLLLLTVPMYTIPTRSFVVVHCTCHVLLLLLTVPMYTIPTRSFVVVHCTCHVLLLLLTVPMYTMLSTTQKPYHVAIVDCTQVGSATVSLKDYVTVAQGNSTNQTAELSMGHWFCI